MSFADLQDATPYEPAGHEGVVNRMLVGRETGVDGVSIWHGVIEPGGGSDVHVHEDAVQVYVGLEGACSVVVEGAEHRLVPMTSVTIQAGVRHAIRNDGNADAALLVVSAPALR